MFNRPQGFPRTGARSPSLLNGAVGRSQSLHRTHVNGSRGNQGADGHANVADTESNEGYSEQESLTSVE